MSDILKTFCGVLALFLLVSCEEKAVMVEALPAMDQEGKICFITSDGRIDSPGLTQSRLSPVVNGYFSASTPDGVTIYRMDAGKAVPVEGLTSLKSAGYMACGVIPVSRLGKHIEIVDEEGKTVSTLQLESGEVTESAPFFSDGVLVVTDDRGKQGLVDTKGNIVADLKYASIGQINEGKMIAIYNTNNNNIIDQHYQVIDTHGKSVYNFQDLVPVSKEVCKNKVVCKSASGYVVVDVTSGAQTNLTFEVRRVDAVAGDYIVYRMRNGKRGVLDLQGREVVPANYDRVRLGPDNTAAVHDGSGWMLINLKTDTKVEFKQMAMLSPAPPDAFKSGFAFVGKNAAGAFLIDKNGKILNVAPLKDIDNATLSMTFVATDYAISTTPVEMPSDFTEVVD